MYTWVDVDSNLTWSVYQVEREKLLNDERVSMQEKEKCNLGATLCRLEEENIELQRQVQNLQAQMAEVESQHAQR